MADMELNNSTNVSINIISRLSKKFKCSNCKLNRDDVNKLNCTRSARYQDNNIKLSCNMYLYKGN